MITGARLKLSDLPAAMRAQIKGSGKSSKYRNRPVIADGRRFDSQLEYRCYQELLLRRMAGEVLWFTRQVPFELPGAPRPVIYRADFLAVLVNGGVEVIDATGMLTQVKRNKLKQVRAIYGVEVKLWSGKR